MGACLSTQKETPPPPEVADNQPRKSVQDPLTEAYIVKRLLGQGAGGDTWLCEDITDHEIVAIKFMKLPIPALLSQAIMREIKLQSELGEGHLNIVKPKELILTQTHLGLVMEYIAGGNLTEFVMSRFDTVHLRNGLCLDEDEARFFFRQLLSAVEYCHSHQVAHRDLKLDNTLISDDEPPRIKLCDFGFARGWENTSNMSTVIGTPDYMAPQLTTPKRMKGEVTYDATKADIWAMGVLLCVMLLGKFPFEGQRLSGTNLSDPMMQIWLTQTKANWRENPQLKSVVGALSPECMDLLDKTFDFHEESRITVQKLKEHPWYTKELSEKFRKALYIIEKEQAIIERKVKSGAYQSKQRDQAILNVLKLATSTKIAKTANGQMSTRIKMDTRISCVTRISLTEVRQHYNALDRRSMKLAMAGQPIPEEGASRRGLKAIFAIGNEGSFRGYKEGNSRRGNKSGYKEGGSNRGYKEGGSTRGQRALPASGPVSLPADGPRSFVATNVGPSSSGPVLTPLEQATARKLAESSPTTSETLQTAVRPVTPTPAILNAVPENLHLHQALYDNDTSDKPVTADEVNPQM